jgi:hypothetical protein
VSELLGNLVGDLQGLVVAGDPLTQDRELVAAQPCDRVVGTERARDALRGLEQHLVAGAVSQRVVDPLEAVEVDEQDGAARLLPAPARQRVLQAIEEQRPVRQTGQRVVQRHVREPVLGVLALGHVDRDAQRADDLAAVVEHRAQVRFEHHPADVEGGRQLLSVERTACDLERIRVERRDLLHRAPDQLAGR